MWRKRALLVLVVVALTLVVAAQVDAVPVTMSLSGYAGQTRVFRGDLSGLGLGSVTGVTVTGGTGGGSDGVFSGFDLDFIVLDRDGDLSTTGDQVLPQTGATTVAHGTVRNPVTSTYQPTALHPGILFGLNPDNSIDLATATITTRDAFFLTALDVDNSQGWVTLGDNGSLTAPFPQTTIGDGLWLLVGEVGPDTTEPISATVEITGQPPVPVPGAVLLASLGAVLVGGLRRRNAL